MAQACHLLADLTSYVRRVWISGSMWRPENWGVYRETVRTNNDVEGWHRRINTRAAKADLGFYVLVPLIKAEANTVDLHIRLVSEHQLTRLHRRQYAKTHGLLFDTWDDYEDDVITTDEVLKRCGHIAGLRPTDARDSIHDEEDY